MTALARSKKILDRAWSLDQEGYFKSVQELEEWFDSCGFISAKDIP